MIPKSRTIKGTRPALEPFMVQYGTFLLECSLRRNVLKIRDATMMVNHQCTCPENQTVRGGLLLRVTFYYRVAFNFGGFSRTLG
jgi:hypothetical protein